MSKRRKKKSLHELFGDWVREGVRVRYLVKVGGGFSKNTITRFIHQQLDKPPEPVAITESDRPFGVYLKIDGTYWKRWGCVLAYKADGDIIYWDCVERETYQDYIRNIVGIHRLGYQVLGVTSDKHSSLVSAVNTLLPNIPHQYCLVHIQRRCQTLLTQNPKTQAGQDLLELVRHLNQLSDHHYKDIWVKWFNRFEDRHLDFVNQRTYATTDEGKKTWWYTHGNVRKAYRHIKTSLDHMFLYLDYPKLPKDTNGLEVEFAHLKDKIRGHWGLRRDRRMNLVRWYFHFKTLVKN